ncbi:hypothetical protein K7432_015436 [Basidiobolus ranarum]|uniref:Uncharacterized protein n=1 Tax=Basidiobolus ranarum TaxID=34480 RepID=A0ABR2WG55_9FUNG
MNNLQRVFTFGLLKRSLYASRNSISIQRYYSSQINVQSEIDKITELFFEARDELEYATESKGSVYYNDEKAAAQAAVTDCLDAFDSLIERLDDTQKSDVQRKIGLKILELRSQLDALTHEELHD